MKRKYFVDAYFYTCPKCKGHVIGKKYYALFSLAEMGAVNAAGLITYNCTHPECRASYSSTLFKRNGDAMEVSKEEALENGIVFESTGSA